MMTCSVASRAMRSMGTCHDPAPSEFEACPSPIAFRMRIPTVIGIAAVGDEHDSGNSGRWAFV